MKNKFIIGFNILGFCFMAFIVYFVSNALYENIYIICNIEEFKSLGVYEKEEFGETKIIYYKVPRETYIKKGWELYHRNAIKDNYIGSSGDILLNKKSPFVEYPIICEFISFFFGGHAAAPMGTESSLGVYDGTAKKILENAGNNPDGNNVAREGVNNWFSSLRRDETIGVRVKGVSEIESYQFIDNLKSRLGEPYNFSFIFNTKNSSYCTDFISKSWKEVSNKYDLNDFFYVSVNDLIISEKTYIFFYKYTSNNVTYIYYLE